MFRPQYPNRLYFPYPNTYQYTRPVYYYPTRQPTTTTTTYYSPAARGGFGGFGGDLGGFVVVFLVAAFVRLDRFRDGGRSRRQHLLHFGLQP